jgi:hypothetical protein
MLDIAHPGIPVEKEDRKIGLSLMKKNSQAQALQLDSSCP